MNKIKFIAVIICIASLFGLRSYWIAEGASRVQAQWDAQIQELIQATASHERELWNDYIAQDSQLKNQNERNNLSDYERTQTMLAHINELESAHSSMQRTIAQQRAQLRELSTRATNASTCPASDEPAPSAWDVLAACSTEYTGVATDAEQLATQVAGLQQYAQLCQQPRIRGKQ